MQVCSSEISVNICLLVHPNSLQLADLKLCPHHVTILLHNPDPPGLGSPSSGLQKLSTVGVSYLHCYFPVMTGCFHSPGQLQGTPVLQHGQNYLLLADAISLLKYGAFSHAAGTKARPLHELGKHLPQSYTPASNHILFVHSFTCGHAELLWMWYRKCLLELLISVLLSIYPEVVLLLW